MHCYSSVTGDTTRYNTFLTCLLLVVQSVPQPFFGWPRCSLPSVPVCVHFLFGEVSVCPGSAAVATCRQISSWPPRPRVGCRGFSQAPSRSSAGPAGHGARVLPSNGALPGGAPAGWAVRGAHRAWPGAGGQRRPLSQLPQRSDRQRRIYSAGLPFKSCIESNSRPAYSIVMTL